MKKYCHSLGNSIEVPSPAASATALSGLSVKTQTESIIEKHRTTTRGAPRKAHFFYIYLKNARRLFPVI